MWGKLVSDSGRTQITGAIVSPAMTLARCVSAIQDLAPRCRQTKSPVSSGVRKSQQNRQAKSCRQDCLLPLCRFAIRRVWQTRSLTLPESALCWKELAPAFATLFLRNARAGLKCGPACFFMVEKIRPRDQLLVVPLVGW